MAAGPAWLSSSGSSTGPPLAYYAPRPQVSYYAAPSRRYTPPQQQQPRPAFQPQGGPPASNWAALEDFAQTDAGQEQIAKTRQAQQAPSGFDKSSGFGGLGFIINNPVTRAITEPLKYIDMGRKLAVLGVEEGAELIDRSPGWVQGIANSTGPGRALLNLIDTERTEEDKRSNWEKLNPNSDYGFGQLLDPDNPAWVNRAVGFAGDVGLDPLTYVTGGASRVVSAGSHADEAARVLTKAQTALKTAEEAGKARDITKAAKALTAAEDYVARAPSMGERFFEEALPHNRAGRVNFFGELSKTPEGQQFLQQFPEQVQRGGQRGLQAMSKEAKDFLRISDPALKIRGLDMRIPGTQTLAKGLVAGGGAARVGADEIPYLDSLRNVRVPKGMRPSWNVLTRGKGGDVALEASTVAIANMMREGTGAQLARGNRIISNGIKKFFKGVDKDGRRAMTQATETSVERTPINDMLKDILDTYQKVVGRDIDREYLKDPDTYFPHLLDPHFRRALGRMAKSGNKSALDFIKHLDFVEDDLLEEPTKFFADNVMEGSGFISKARRFGTDKNGAPQTFNIGGRDITFEADDVGHLNEQLKAAFPEYKGNFYDDDPVRVMEAYNKSLSRQAGRDMAARRMEQTVNPMVESVTGDIEATRQAMEEALSQQGAAPLLSTAQGEYIPGELPEIPPTPIVPGSYQERAPIEKLRAGAEEATDPATKRVLTEEADRLQAEVTASRIGGVEPSDYFVTTKGDNATKAHYAAARRGKTYATAIGGETRVAEEKLRQRIADVRETIITPLKSTVKETKAQISGINNKIKTWAKTIDDMGDLNPENFEEFSELITRVQNEVLNGEMKMKHTARAWKGSGTKAQRKAEAEMKESLNRLRRVRDDAWEKVKDAPEAMRTELAERERILNQPVRDAHDALLWKEMEVPIPHSQAEQDRAITNAMEGYDAGTDPEVLLKNYRDVAQGVRREANVVAPGIVPDTPEIAAARQAYHDAVAEVHALGAKYTKKGRIPKSAKEQYDSAVAAKAELDRLTGEATNISEYDAAILQMDELERQIEIAARGGDLGTAQFPEGYNTIEEVQQGLADGSLNIGDLGKGLGPGDVPRLTAERNRIARKFHQGGRFYKQKQARGVLADWGTYEKKVLDKTTSERAALEKAIESRARRQESIIWAQAEQEGWHPANRLRYVTGVGENPSNLEGMGWGVGQQRIPEAITEPPQEAAWYTKTRAPSGEMGMRGVPPPRTEQEALTSLRSQVEIGSGEQLAARAQAMRATENLAKREAAAPAELAAKQAELAAINAEDMDRALGPLAERAQTYTNLLTDLSDKKSMVIKRDEAAAFRDRLKANPTNPRTDLDRVLDELDAVAKANPYLQDEKLNQVESLLHTHRAELERIDKAQIRMRDLDRVAQDAADGTLGDISIVALNNNWHTLHNGPLNTGDIIMDMELYKRFNNLFELSRQPKLFGRTFNAFTNLFKTYATLSPGFHIRNTIGGIFMNTSDGVALARQLEGAQLWQKFTRGGEEWLGKQEKRIQDAFSATFASGAGGRFEESGVLARTENRLYNMISSNPATRLSQRAGTRVEGGLRLGMALDSIDNGASVQDALSRITRIHFDYAQVSEIDETMKRIIPFWTFMSRNLPLQIEQMWTKPRVYAYYNSLIRNFSLPDEEFTPDYWTRQGAWRTPVEIGGNPLYLQPDLGFTRVQSDLKLAEGVLSGENPGALVAQTNPLIGGTMDFISKRDSFYNRQYDPTDYTKQSGMIGAPLTLIAKMLGQTNEAGQVSDNFTNYMQSLVPPLNQGVRLFPGATGGKRTAQTGVKWARYAGVPIQLLTPEAQDSEYWRQYREILDEQERQQSMLEEAAS